MRSSHEDIIIPPPLQRVPIIHRVLLFAAQKESMHHLLGKSVTVTSSWRDAVVNYAAPLLEPRMRYFKELDLLSLTYGNPTQMNFTKQLVLSCRRDVVWFFDQCVYTYKTSDRSLLEPDGVFDHSLKRTYFLEACTNGSLECLKVMLREKEMFDMTDFFFGRRPKKSESAAAGAVESSKTTTTVATKTKGAGATGPGDDDADDPFEKTIFHELCSVDCDKHLRTLKFLLDYIDQQEQEDEEEIKIDTKKKTKEQQLPSTRMLSLRVTPHSYLYGRQKETHPRSHETPAFLAAGAGAVDTLKYLISRDDFNPSALNGFGHNLIITTLHGAQTLSSSLHMFPGHCYDSSHVVLRDDSKNNNSRTTTTKAGAADKYARVVEMLINAGCSVGTVAQDGMTALHYACKASNLHAARLLISNGAKINVTDKDLVTPLHLACEFPSSSLVRLLLCNNDNNNGASSSSSSSSSSSPKNKNSSTTTTTNTSDGNNNNKSIINAADKKGMRPIHYLAQQFTLPTPLEVAQFGLIIKMFKENGGDINAQDNDGNTPVHLSCSKFGVTEVLAALIDNGLSKDLLNNAGQYPDELLRGWGRGGSDVGSIEDGLAMLRNGTIDGSNATSRSTLSAAVRDAASAFAQVSSSGRRLPRPASSFLP